MGILIQQPLPRYSNFIARHGTLAGWVERRKEFSTRPLSPVNNQNRRHFQFFI